MRSIACTFKRACYVFLFPKKLVSSKCAYKISHAPVMYDQAVELDIV